MHRILFVCHGNICRSPMAEFIFKSLIHARGLDACYDVHSAATSREELGSPVYPPAARELAKHGISCKGKTARQVEPEDYGAFDHIIYMESYNHPRLVKRLGSDPAGKCRRLLDFTEKPGDVDDPWYTGDFARAYREIQAGCEALLEHLEEKG